MPEPFRLVIEASPYGFAVAVLTYAFATPLMAFGASAAEVTIYTSRSIAVNAPAGATVVHLDAAETIEAELSASLPHDPAGAVGLARQRLSDGGAKLQRDLAAAYEDIAGAWSLGVTTLPAVVVDRRYVVYGEPDVAKAVAKIEAFRRTQP